MVGLLRTRPAGGRTRPAGGRRRPAGGRRRPRRGSPAAPRVWACAPSSPRRNASTRPTLGSSGRPPSSKRSP
uniref:Uncharacterized protein n=1 Tax=uncultured marine virus TaxID=186617 RepID=A0A0F7L6A9_9VIRU|nr:hypothetical protein [uncultured marine virus]